MKLINIVFLEAKKNLIQIFLCFIILTFIFIVIFCLISISSTVSDGYINEINLNNPDGFKLNFYNALPDQIAQIEEIGLKNVNIERFDKISKIQSFIKIDGKKDVPEQISFRLMSNNINESIIYGEGTNGDNDNELYVWITSCLAEDLNVDINDSIVFSNGNSKKYSYILKGIVDWDFDMEVYLSSNSLIVLMEEAEISTKFSGFGKIDNVSDYMKISKSLFDMNIYNSGIDGYEKILQGIYYIQYIFYALIVLILLAGVGIINNLSSMFIRKRKQFFGILKALGIRDIYLLYIIGIILSIVLLLSVLLGYLIGYLIAMNINNEIFRIFNYHSIIKYDFSSFFLIVIVSFIVLLISLLFMFKNIKGINIIRIITIRE